MSSFDIVTQRLNNQNLLEDKLNSPQEVIKSLLAVQSQDYPGAKWAIAQRTNTTSSNIDTLFNDGQILRTHIMRPTWHFVLPEDILWLIEATGPRVNARSVSIYKTVGLDDTIFNRSSEIICNALAGKNFLTREELTLVLQKHKFPTEGLRSPFLIIHAELEGLICSGPLKAKQHTYALISERAPKAKRLSLEQSFAELAYRYFASHGPATVQDFSWWSWQTLTDSKKAIASLGSRIQSEVIGDQTYWFTESNPINFSAPVIHLLPNYDEYTVAYKDRSTIIDPSALLLKNLDSRGNPLFNNLITLNGRAIGGWRRELKKDKVIVEINLERKLNRDQNQALELAVQKFGNFLDLPAVIVFKEK